MNKVVVRRLLVGFALLALLALSVQATWANSFVCVDPPGLPPEFIESNFCRPNDLPPVLVASCEKATAEITAALRFVG